MTRVELVSLFWCSLAVLVLIGVVVATVRMGLDEQREREAKFSGLGDVPRSPQQTTPAETSDARPADFLES